MDPCNVFLVDSDGSKRSYTANLNQKLAAFLRSISILTGRETTLISLGEQFYGRDYNDYTLRQLGFRQGIDVELMSDFKGGGGPTIPFMFNSLSQKKIINFGSAPYLRVVCRGVSFFGVCKNRRCEAFDSEAICTLGYGEFDIRDTVECKVKCPVCYQKMLNSCNFGFYMAKWKIKGVKGVKVGGGKFKFEDESWDEHFTTFKEGDNIDWQYMTLTVSNTRTS
ncbi:hypothetical protein SteCoe_19963 [Stentor coeruleus]|uniref:Ubiquitin-like domain-containing protein n=1 Tax=Stentor coeruleus TaxID=5963 RepID=A0A1R2BT43_9CILI|nr:hypothetical protein SteCoe_19963 [Stentor coeruleus]